MILVPLFDLKFLTEFAASGVGTSNRRHSMSWPGFRRRVKHPGWRMVDTELPLCIAARATFYAPFEPAGISFAESS